MFDTQACRNSTQQTPKMRGSSVAPSSNNVQSADRYAICLHYTKTYNRLCSEWKGRPRSFQVQNVGIRPQDYHHLLLSTDPRNSNAAHSTHHNLFPVQRLTANSNEKTNKTQQHQGTRVLAHMPSQPSRSSKAQRQAKSLSCASSRHRQ